MLGYDGIGRIELDAHNAPHIQIIIQYTNYSSTTEYLRLGEGCADPKDNHLAYNARGGSTSSG